MKVLKFGGKIDLIRQSQGLTIAELSRKSGVNDRTLERILAGQNAPDAANMLRLLKALNINIAAIAVEDLE